MSIEKPKLKSRNFYDYNEVIHYIEKKYKIDTRDYANSFKKAAELQDKFVKETGIKINGNTKYTSPEYLKFLDWVKERFKALEIVNGVSPRLPYLDFWHWVNDLCFYDAGNGTIAYLPVKKSVVIKEHPDAPDWVLEIFDYIEKEFGDLAKAEDDWRIPVLLEW